MIATARSLCPPGRVLELGVRGAPRWLERGGPRRLVPVRDWRVRLGGSRLHPAFRPLARAYRTALRAWITLGAAPLTHRVNAGRGGDWPLGDFLLPDMPTLSTAAVSVGIPGPAQKITVQLMDGRGRTLGFAKYAEAPYPRKLLANEARMLESLPGGVGPRLVRLTTFLRGDLLVQTAVPGRPHNPRPRLDAAQVRLFERLTRPGESYPVLDHPFIGGLYERARERGGMLETVVESFGESEWPAAWTHGDMAPWNMHRWRGRCLAFDWEHGRETGFAYLDAAATLIQVAAIIKRFAPERAKRAVSEGLAPCLPAQHRAFASAVASLSALDMLASWYPPRPPDANEAWLREFIGASA